MGQKSPVKQRSNAPAGRAKDSADSDDVDKQAARLRARIDQLAIGDRAVYDEDSMPNIK